MADRIPLVLNTTDKRIEQVQSSDTVYMPKDLSVYSDIRSAHIDDSNALNTGYYARTDFLTHGLTGGFFTSSATSNGSISVASVNPSSNNGCMNYLTLSTLTNPTSKPNLSGTNLYLNSSFAEYEFYARVSFNSLSTADNKYGFHIGIISSTDESIGGYNGIVLWYDPHVNSNDNWYSCTTTTSNYTLTSTATAATTAWQKLYFKLDRNNSAPRVRFYINNSLVTTHTANIPDSTSDSRLKIIMFKRTGTTACEARLDYAFFKITYLSRQTRF